MSYPRGTSSHPATAPSPSSSSSSSAPSSSIAAALGPHQHVDTELTAEYSPDSASTRSQSFRSTTVAASSSSRSGTTGAGDSPFSHPSHRPPLTKTSTSYVHPPFQPSNLSTAQSNVPPTRPTHPAVTTVSSTDASSSTGVRRRLSNPPNAFVNLPQATAAPTARRPSRRASLFTPAEDLGIGSSSTTITYSNPFTWFGGASGSGPGSGLPHGADGKAKRKKSSEDFDKDYSSDRSRDSSGSSSKKRISHNMSRPASGRLTSDSDGSPPLHPVKLAFQNSLSNRPSFTNMSLTPLPQDPNNILPLSLPSTPYATPLHTPGISPHPSISDMKDYIGSYDPSRSSSSAGPSSNRSPSPRTSISTATDSSYDPSRSDSRSSISGDEAAPMLRSAGWWARTGQPHSTLRAARSKMISLPPIPTGTRSWGWLMGMLPLSQGSHAPMVSTGKAKTRRFRTRRDTMRERERLVGKPRQRDAITGVHAIDRCLESLPAKPMTIILSLLAFAAFALFTTVTLKHVLNPDKAPLPWRTYCSSSHPTVYSLQHDSTAQTTSYFGDSNALTLAPLTPAHPQWPYASSEPPTIASSVELAPVGVFVGVFTTDEKVERRNMIRQSYGSHPRSRRAGTEAVKVMFIMGRPRHSYLKAVQLESEAFGDILLLDMPENMNSGKTHAFFTWAADYASVPDVEYVLDDSDLIDATGDSLDDVRVKAVHKGERKPDYIVKADDDSFIMLGELERRLRVAPRTKAYWGYLVKNSFMAGEAYGLSMDLVNYIATSPRVRSITRGKEDKLVSKWMRMHPQATEIAWVTEKCWIYDHPKAGTVYSHGFLFPSTVAQIRSENATGLDLATISARGGPSSYQSYSSVSRFNSLFRPMAHDLSAGESVESLIEGSELSHLDPRSHPISQHKLKKNPLTLRAEIRQVYADRPSRRERFMHDDHELGGTVVIHYIKKAEWFVETWLALLGGVEEEDGRILPSSFDDAEDFTSQDIDGVKLGKGPAGLR